MQQILIQPFYSGWRCALLDNGTLFDFSFEPLMHSKNAHLDDIICGRVVAVRGDFVWFDLGLDREGVVKTSLFYKQKPHEGLFMWLQVVREPWPEIGTNGQHEKGYRLTPHITFAGRYWVHNPLARSESKWIRRSAALDLSDDSPDLSAEKIVLTKQAELLKIPPEKVGVLARAHTQWQRWIRDSSDNMIVTCETPLVARFVKEWVAKLYPEKKEFVTLALQTESPLFENFGIEDLWSDALSPHVMLHGGGSLDIRELAAATLIDVNTGALCDNFLSINIKALKTTAQQIKLRHITGNILVDFIRLNKAQQIDFLKHIYETFKSTDIRVLGFCELGLLQLQRTRYRPSLLMQLMKNCPTCHGDGLVSLK